MSLTIKIVSLIIILLSLFVYYRQVVQAKQTSLGEKILARASQLTMSAFVLGLGILLFELNAMGLSRSKFIDHLLLYGAFVSLVTILSIGYYKRTLKES